MENEVQNIKIAGSGRISGGTYREVSIAGSGTVAGDLISSSLHASGSARIDGSVQTGECRISGSGHIRGNLSANDIRIAGSANVEGDIACVSEFRISGSGKMDGSVKAQAVSFSGSVKVGNGIACETMTANGAFTVGGLLNADTLNVTLSGNCEADEIGGETISVKRAASTTFNLFGLSFNFSAGTGRLTANTIEAGKITLENTTTDTVRGDVIEIGAGCKIKRVEYRESLIVSSDAEVEEQVKFE